MKVIKDGRVENKPKAINCTYCKSTLEVCPSDIHHRAYDQRNGDAYVFVCAVCLREIWIDMDVLGWQGV